MGWHIRKGQDKKIILPQISLLMSWIVTFTIEAYFRRI